MASLYEYSSLGFMNPFYLEKQEGIVVGDFKSLALLSSRVLDTTSVVQILNKSHTLGDRTLIEGVKMTPWNAYLSHDKNKWEYNKYLPRHGYELTTPEVAADKLYEKLEKELATQLVGKKKIGILLSGGMDSRVVAAIVNNILSGSNVEVVGLTWGLVHSRDVVYAQRICKDFEWEFRHFKLDADMLRENIDIAAEAGAIYSPVHLHAMPSISKQTDLDIILAGSFGDSVGRAEYSGTSLVNLKSLNYTPRSKFNLIKRTIIEEAKSNIANDIKLYRELFPRDEEYQHCEIEKQAHYMRKQLNQCMAFINDRIPLYQAFTSVEVYGYIWGLDPTIRTDEIYYKLLTKYSPSLLDIPWARTGTKYFTSNSESSPLDELSKDHHDYGTWIRHDLYEDIKNLVLSDAIDKIGIFNMSSLKELISLNKGIKGKMTMVDEYLIWIACLAKFIERYNISNNKKSPKKIIGVFDVVFTKSEFYAFKIKNKI
ncbi:asparagine synthase-related protein [Vibrio breoganii]|uniref:asparagine synthase-related protein n=1 Tax=Vibrio breoganii TaxID=553239 RepID=UPI0021C41E70|nr:asparagine synthase-related protein [Vibrio breoganii]MDN3715955.1 asparagine synthase-related protein [Vibrio breoganii]